MPSSELDKWFKRPGLSLWENRQSFKEKAFQAHVEAIGHLVLAWNDLHERFASLYASAVGGGDVGRVLRIWNTITSDMHRRKMLAIAISDISADEIKGRPKLKREIEWILEKTKNLEGYRDDAVHTPLHFWPSERVVELKVGGKLVERNVFGSDTFNNRRAKRINEAENRFIDALTYAYEQTISLRDYAYAIDLAWSHDHLPWPERPPWKGSPPPKPSKKAPRT